MSQNSKKNKKQDKDLMALLIKYNIKKIDIKIFPIIALVMMILAGIFFILCCSVMVSMNTSDEIGKCYVFLLIPIIGCIFAIALASTSIKMGFSFHGCSVTTMVISIIELVISVGAFNLIYFCLFLVELMESMS